MKNLEESRSLTGGVEIIQRTDGKESRTIQGYALKFDKWSKNLGWFKEKIDKRAFDDVDMSEVVATFNHDFNLPMARVDSDTLTLTTDEIGIRYMFEAPHTTAGNDLLESIRNRNVKGSSFYFEITKGGDKWKANTGSDIEERTITKINRLFELGPVMMPAYPDTTALASMRSEQRASEKKKVVIGDLLLKRKRTN